MNGLHVKAHYFNRGGSMDGVNVFGVIIWNVNVIGLTPGPSPEERGKSLLVNAMRIFVKFFILVSAEFSKPQNSLPLCDSPLLWRVASD
jgi:hypothetical protein